MVGNAISAVGWAGGNALGAVGEVAYQAVEKTVGGVGRLLQGAPPSKLEVVKTLEGRMFDLSSGIQKLLTSEARLLVHSMWTKQGPLIERFCASIDHTWFRMTQMVQEFRRCANLRLRFMEIVDEAPEGEIRTLYLLPASEKGEVLPDLKRERLARGRARSRVPEIEEVPVDVFYIGEDSVVHRTPGVICEVPMENPLIENVDMVIPEGTSYVSSTLSSPSNFDQTPFVLFKRRGPGYWGLVALGICGLILAFRKVGPWWFGWGANAFSFIKLLKEDPVKIPKALPPGRSKKDESKQDEKKDNQSVSEDELRRQIGEAREELKKFKRNK